VPLLPRCSTPARAVIAAGVRLLSACLLALAAATAARAAPVIYVLDPEHSFVHFEVLHFGTSTLRGRFGQIDGYVELDRAAPSGWVSLRIPTAAVDTGMPAFDARLRRSDLLDSDAHPLASFVASRLRFDGPTLSALSGELTLRGVRQTLELRALRFGCHIHPQLQREVCGGDFEGELERGDFGASFGMPFVANRVRLRVQVEGIRRQE
jgi:polyisoprenoid-binding protein YceI